ncbi:hypothetical protein CUMW_169500 [Citrus unshiu]|uniref:Uncharacterized protein n=1 Tax=Citrus unshiu TaxID=55188 RepID=A0A2H5PUV8_CITUN|nr:hypothetical protein CUMW_169500 [Citrus unshiu]
MGLVMPVILQLVKLCVIGFAFTVQGSAGYGIPPSPAIIGGHFLLPRLPVTFTLKPHLLGGHAPSPIELPTHSAPPPVNIPSFSPSTPAVSVPFDMAPPPSLIPTNPVASPPSITAPPPVNMAPPPSLIPTTPVASPPPITAPPLVNVLPAPSLIPTTPLASPLSSKAFPPASPPSNAARPPASHPSNTARPPASHPSRTAPPPASHPSNTALPSKTAPSPASHPSNTALPPASLPSKTAPPPASHLSNTAPPPASHPYKTSPPPASHPSKTAPPPASHPSNTAPPPASHPSNTALPPASHPSNTAPPPASHPSKTAPPPASHPSNTALPPASHPSNPAIPPASHPSNTAIPPASHPSNTAPPHASHPSNTALTPASHPSNIAPPPLFVPVLPSALPGKAPVSQSPISLPDAPAATPRGNFHRHSPAIHPSMPGPLPPVAQKRNASNREAPIAEPIAPGPFPPGNSRQKSPVARPIIPGGTPTASPDPDVPPSTPPLSVDGKRVGKPVAEPSYDIPIPPPVNHSPSKAPSTHKYMRHSNHSPLPPFSSPKPPQNNGNDTPVSSPLASFPKHRDVRNKIASSPAPSYFISPTTSIHQGPVVPPSFIPTSRKRHYGPPPLNSVSPSHSPLPTPVSRVPTSPSPSPTSASGQTELPLLPPKSSPSEPIRAFPPPPPNADCSTTICTEPYTNTPPGSPCGCVWPMQVGLRLSVALYTFFPLVSELAGEIAAGVFMKQSQVRIIGANAAEQPDKTVVLTDLVPLGEKFDNTTAFLTYQRFWHKQVVIKSSYFGDYEVLYVRYPGLPPSPPSASSSIGIIDDGPYSGNNGRATKPEGVDVPKRRQKYGLSGGMIAIVVLSAFVAVVLCSAAAWVLLFKYKSHACQAEEVPQSLQTSHVKPSGAAGLMVGSGLDSASLSFGSSIATYTGYVAPEYAMTGHLLVKSDVYSYGVVILELLSGRKPVDMTQPPGQENLVAWARPLLTSREGLERIIDPSLGNDVPFDSVAKVAAIASMCVQPEVQHRPFMGEVVQALKLVCNECDEAKEVGSASSSQDDMSIDLDSKVSTGSGQLPDPLQRHYSVPNYDLGLDTGRRLSLSYLFSSSARSGKEESELFRRYSSSGPLRTGPAARNWTASKLDGTADLFMHESKVETGLTLINVKLMTRAGLKRQLSWLSCGNNNSDDLSHGQSAMY